MCRDSSSPCYFSVNLVLISIDIDMEVNFKIKMLNFRKRFEEKTFGELKKKCIHYNEVDRMLKSTTFWIIIETNNISTMQRLRHS